MPTKTELETKIKALEQCLTDNPNHPDRITIEADLRNLRTQLENVDYDN
jgi:hypothetical protein